MDTQPPARKAARPSPAGKRLAERDIERARAGDSDRWLIDAERTRGVGRLAVRITPGGAKRFYFRYTASGKRVDLTIGPWSADGDVGTFTLEQARARSAEWSALLQGAAAGDLKGYLERRERGAVAAALDASLQAASRTGVGPGSSDPSFQALLNAYVDSLRVAGKGAARDVANLFGNHVSAPWPELAAAPATSITKRHIVAIVRRVVHECKRGRTAGKLRSYLHAAFEAACSKDDPSLPESLDTFGIEANPVARVGALPQFNRKRNRALDSREIGYFWARLRDRDDFLAKTLAIALLLGGQRLAQLLRLTCANVNLVDRILVIHDGKGRRATPREHALPLSDRVHALLAPLVDRSRAANCPLVFSATLRKRSCTESVSEIVNTICEEMLTAEEATEKFELRDLRRTAETQLAALSVRKDHRARLQSHGIAGVQDVHYDQYEYMAEKRSALDLWQRKLDEWAAEAIAARKPQLVAAGSNVIDLGSRRARK